MGKLTHINDRLARYKVELTEAQKEQINQREFIDSLIGELKETVTGSQKGLVEQLIDALPKLDLSPVVDTLEVILDAMVSLTEKVDSIEIPEAKEQKATDITPILERIDGIKFPEIKFPEVKESKKTSWDFEIERDKRGRMIGVIANPRDMV